MSPILTKNRLSRWGKSTYETNENIGIEKRELSKHVQVIDDNKDAEIIIIHSKFKFNADVIAGLKFIKLLITTTSGYDHIDLEACAKRKISVARLPIVRRDAVVETALGMMLYGLRAFPEFQESAKTGHWSRSELPRIAPKSLVNQKIGIIGCGVIGRQMIHVLQAMGAAVYAWDPVNITPLVPALKFEDMTDCDIVSLHCNLNTENRFMISKEWLQNIKPGMILINTARGKLVDVDAALNALDDGRLKFLGLDVFPEEPYPLLSSAVGRPNLIMTPHAAGFHLGLSDMIRAGLVKTVVAFNNKKQLPHEVHIANLQ